MNRISAVDIKELYHIPIYDTDGKTELIPDDLTPKLLKSLLTSKAQKIDNVHQDTWTIDESEPSQDQYKNQLTGATYRMGSKTMGDVAFNFTIGQYDYATKKELMGGELVKTGTGEVVGWKRARGIVEIHKTLVALTEDDVYCILPYASISTREANTDGAVGLAVVGTMLEPKNQAVMPEYWFDKAEVDLGETSTVTAAPTQAVG